jgi:chemotaxis receptor (MCP) glutamine deamidase CheD
MLRCIGAAVVGAVRVVGGADHVMLPRLPAELPPPARA